jgi:hypothetical protein
MCDWCRVREAGSTGYGSEVWCSEDCHEAYEAALYDHLPSQRETPAAPLGPYWDEVDHFLNEQWERDRWNREQIERQW